MTFLFLKNLNLIDVISPLYKQIVKFSLLMKRSGLSRLSGFICGPTGLLSGPVTGLISSAIRCMCRFVYVMVSAMATL